MHTRTNTFHPQAENRAHSLAGIPLASFTRRTLAILIDFLIAGILFLALVVGGGSLIQRLGLVAFEQNVDLQFTFFKNWYSIVWLVCYFTLSLYFGKGKTFGKKICRIRVVSLVHDHLSFWHSLERSLGYGASLLEAGFGFIQYFLRPDRRTIHDRIAETIVIAEPKNSS